MSTIVERARAEADEVEEAEEEEQATEGAEEPAEEPAGPSAQEPSEPTDAQLKRLDAEQRRHEARVVEIMGHFVEGFVACGKCGGVGLTPSGPEPRTHEDYRACEICSGFGEVLTGSLNPQHSAAPCPRCGGRGYLERKATAAPPAQAAQPQPTAVEEWGVPSWMGDPSVGAPGTFTP